jgi:hypothetical protein
MDGRRVCPNELLSMNMEARNRSVSMRDAHYCSPRSLAMTLTLALLTSQVQVPSGLPLNLDWPRFLARLLAWLAWLSPSSSVGQACGLRRMGSDSIWCVAVTRQPQPTIQIRCHGFSVTNAWRPSATSTMPSHRITTFTISSTSP